MAVRILGALLLAGLGAGCESGEDPPPTGPATWAAEVHPLLTGECMSCHQSGGSAGTSALVLYDDPAVDHAIVLTLVDLADPASSELLLWMAGDKPHPGPRFAKSSTQYTRALAWIERGAPQTEEP